MAESLVANEMDFLDAESVAQTRLDSAVAQSSIDLDDDEGNSMAGDKDHFTLPVMRLRPPVYNDVAREFGGLEEVTERCGMAEG